VVGLAVLAALLFRTFLFEAFSIPSGSMLPTLLAGDTVIVAKLAYGLSRYSLPIWHPPFVGRLFGRLPARGDVVVFKLPRQPNEDYIKRVVGLPGDRVQMIGGVLYVNGTAAAEERVADWRDPDDAGLPRIPQLEESLPGGEPHPILKQRDHAPLDDTLEWLVPDDAVFVMGDNRDASEDSRAMNQVGFVPLDNLVGRAEFRLFSLADRTPWWALWRWPATLRIDRALTRIR
jgi:signal peptidase I